MADLPSGVSGNPQYEVMNRVTATFTFSAAKAAAAAAAAGQPAPRVPAGLDGSRFRLVVGPGTAEIWPRSSGIPALVVARVTGPVTSSKSDVDVVVTEHGVADLRACTVSERAERLVAVAHPDHRAALSRA